MSEKPFSAKWPEAVSYEIFVQSFADSNGDGIGDINGLRAKLDYLHDLGVKGIWLMPINPSPSYHKYDITDYYGIHQDYGTIDDFKMLVEEAHAKDIAIIIDLVINHCSKGHPWFQKALNPTSGFRDFFIWQDLASIEKENSFEKSKTGDSDNTKQWNQLPDQEELYYSFFWIGMPDLNYDNPKVREEVYKIGKYWLEEMQVDGFRLDAAKHIYPDHRAADNHAFWKTFKAEMQKVKPNVFLIGEVWDDLETQAPYAQGFSSLFNFDLAYAILETVNRESIVTATIFQDSWKINESGSLVDLIIESESTFKSYNPQFLNGTFLSNHDQNRVFSFLQNVEIKAKLVASILLTIPGSPYIYYGEELGMTGKKPDPNIREPMIWSNKHDKYRAAWMIPKYNLDENTKGAEEQQQDVKSMLNHYKRLILLRNSKEALSIGSISSLDLAVPDKQLLAYRRKHNDDSFIVFHNLSGKPKVLTSDYENHHLVWSTNPFETNKKLTLPPYSSLILKTPKLKK
ncbi:MAG: alpha-amylase family glycosyl hydrolase [Cyclobacteriaceae bacterium]